MSPGDPSDAALVARAVADGDRRAFGELVRRHQSAIRTLLRRLCAGDAARADDLAQEAFLRAHRKLSSYRGEARFATWLHRVAWNTFLSETRRRPLVDPAQPAADVAGAGEHARAEARVDLARAFAVLREEERAALALAYGADLTHEEAAHVLGWPLGTLKTHLARGKERLRRHLQDRSEATA